MKKVGAGMAAFGATSATLLALLTPILVSNEGLKTKAYLDPIGVPTACVGETRGIKLGQSFTPEECKLMLAARIEEFDRELGKCVHGVFPIEVRAAVLDWAYNVGSGAACKSTLVKKLNKGDLVGACGEFKRWNKPDLPGIRKRRQMETDLCMKGATQ